MTVTRRHGREWAVQMLSAADMNPPSDLDVFISEFWQQLDSLNKIDGGIADMEEINAAGSRFKEMCEFAEERFTGVMDHLQEIDEKLAKLLTGWDIYRLGTVERAVLRMGIWEMDFTDVPKPVVINEAIDIANWFSSSRSRKLINGVLDRYAKHGADAVAGN